MFSNCVIHEIPHVFFQQGGWHMFFSKLDGGVEKWQGMSQFTVFLLPSIMIYLQGFHWKCILVKTNDRKSQPSHISMSTRSFWFINYMAFKTSTHTKYTYRDGFAITSLLSATQQHFASYPEAIYYTRLLVSTSQEKMFGRAKAFYFSPKLRGVVFATSFFPKSHE